MDNDRYIPYVYQILHTPSGLKYIGSRYSKGIRGRIPEDDLGVYYWSSSSHELFNKWYQVNNQNEFEYKVLFCGIGSCDEELKLNVVDTECQLHELYNVMNDDLYVNKAKQTSTKFCYIGTPRKGAQVSQETRLKMSIRKHALTDCGLTVGQLGAKRGVETNIKTKGNCYFSDHVRKGHETRKNNGTDITTNKKMSEGHKRKGISIGSKNPNCAFIKVYDRNGKLVICSFLKDVSDSLGISKHLIRTALSNDGKIKQTHRTKSSFFGKEHILDYTFTRVSGDKDNG